MKANVKSVKVSTRKVRLVGDVIRKKSVNDAFVILNLTKKHGAIVLKKALQNAVANAATKQISEDNLMIKDLIINEGQFLKRFHASTRGRAKPYKKRTTHIRIVLKEKEVKEGGSKD